MVKSIFKNIFKNIISILYYIMMPVNLKNKNNANFSNEEVNKIIQSCVELDYLPKIQDALNRWTNDKARKAAKISKIKRRTKALGKIDSK